MANLLDIKTWSIGNGSVIGFPETGNDAENVRSVSVDPWNRPAVVWQAQYDGVNSGYGDGGWWISSININNMFTYRFSVWVRVIATGTLGSIYYGTNGWDASTQVGLTELGGANNTNSYFYTSASPPNPAIFPVNTWVLLVGHVHLFGYAGGAHSESGIWTISGTKLANMNYEFKWRADNTRAEWRLYLVYSHPNTDTITQFLYPRLDMRDGTEPTLTQLLRGHKYMTALRTSSGTFNIKTQRL